MTDPTLKQLIELIEETRKAAKDAVSEPVGARAMTLCGGRWNRHPRPSPAPPP